ncbi:unnamed protein product [Nippostrongylus brasiliensis]|uniref:Uncharacterized protein n=1 Tax=Nippostrongylus brasiliensis TaxID=27835 RepID=A0A158QWH4_NIPBR|nr:unnamed protein product [Nippostrongylus brasiliensis]
MSTRQHRGGAEKCRCCPYGFHIDVDFVAYAEDVRKGGTSRTPTLPRKAASRTLPRDVDNVSNAKRFQNGYVSDYTGCASQTTTPVDDERPVDSVQTAHLGLHCARPCNNGNQGSKHRVTISGARQFKDRFPGMSDFASLRRGREYAMSETETPNRVRYYSASPKMPRKLQAVPPLPAPSQFTYTHQNGNTMLAKTQGTSMSPPPADIEKAPQPKETVSIGVCTGPLPPAKPCNECSNLRKELSELLKR